MILKNGFLLIELLIGLTLFCFLIFIVTHYIIQLKNIQQACLFRIEALSLARNCAEKHYAGTHTDQLDLSNEKIVIVSSKEKKLCTITTITALWTLYKKKHLLHIHTFLSSDYKESHEV